MAFLNLCISAKTSWAHPQRLTLLNIKIDNINKHIRKRTNKLHATIFTKKTKKTLSHKHCKIKKVQSLLQEFPSFYELYLTPELFIQDSHTSKTSSSGLREQQRHSDIPGDGPSSTKKATPNKYRSSPNRQKYALSYQIAKPKQTNNIILFYKESGQPPNLDFSVFFQFD